MITFACMYICKNVAISCFYQQNMFFQQVSVRTVIWMKKTKRSIGAGGTVFGTVGQARKKDVENLGFPHKC